MLFSQQLVKRELVCEKGRSESEKINGVQSTCSVCDESVCSARQPQQKFMSTSDGTKSKSRETESQKCSDAAGRYVEHLVDEGPDEHSFLQVCEYVC